MFVLLWSYFDKVFVALTLLRLEAEQNVVDIFETF